MEVVKKAKRRALEKDGRITCCKEVIYNQDQKVFIEFETGKFTSDLVSTV